MKRNGALFVTEHFTLSGHTVTFRSDPGPHACPQPGKYKWVVLGDRLRFTRISDACPGRLSTLGYELTKVS